jgi:hypothetical protein
MIAHFITVYEFKFENEKTPKTLSWDFAVVPHPRAKLLVRQKTF